MSVRKSLALDLASLDSEPLEPMGADGLRLESLMGGHAMAEVGASYAPNCTGCCSCCITCCCCG